MKVNLNVSGFETEATFPEADVKRIHQPLIEKFTRLYHEKQERIVVFLCAPPGSGKSTLAAFWEYLSEQDENQEPLQVLPFDGFHYPNEILDSNTIERNGERVPLRSIKGSYETFNLTELIDKLKQLKVKDSKYFTTTATYMTQLMMPFKLIATLSLLKVTGCCLMNQYGKNCIVWQILRCLLIPKRSFYKIVWSIVKSAAVQTQKRHWSSIYVLMRSTLIKF